MKPMKQHEMEAASPFKDAAEAARDRIIESVHRIERDALLAGSRVQVHLLQAASRGREVVHRHPFTSVIVAAGVGAILGGLGAYIATKGVTVDGSGTVAGKVER